MYLAPVETDETQRQNTPAPDSFFGAAEGGRGESSPGGGFADDDFFPEEDAAPLPAAPVSRAPRPAPTPAEAGSRVVPQGQGQAPRRGGSSGQPPAQTRPQVGAPQPPRNDGNDRDDMTDPFDE